MARKKGTKLDEKRVRTLTCESFIILPYSSYRNFGIAFGRVVRIHKGNEYDVIELNTGKGIGDMYTRSFTAKEQSARKQVATLTTGQFTIIFCETPKFQKHQRVNIKQKMCANVLAFWPVYIPTKFDRQDLEEEQNHDKMVDFISESEENKINADFLTQFERKKDNE